MRRSLGLVEGLEERQLLAIIVVNTALDHPALVDNPLTGVEEKSLRVAIEEANSTTEADSIVFQIPAAMDGYPRSPGDPPPTLDVPVPGFDPVFQTWRIALDSPLPAITEQLTIDGYSQAHFPVLFRYPSQVAQSILVDASATAGTFTLTTVAPVPGLPSRTTAPIPYDATAAQVLAALNDIVGVGNVFVSGGDANVSPIRIAYIGEYITQRLGTPAMTVDGAGLVGGSVTVEKVVDSATPPREIASKAASRLPALDRNNAEIRLVLDGSAIGAVAYPDSIGFEINHPHSILRGFAIEGFDVGVAIGDPSGTPIDAEGVLVQGNAIGRYALYPVDPYTGEKPTGTAVAFGGGGNVAQGVLVNATNATIGGTAPQDANVIAGNGAEGISILAGAQGNQVVGNQIGVVGPTDSGYYIAPGNGGDGVRVASDLNAIGGSAPGAGNVISANGGHGVHLLGATATRNRIEGNYIGVAPGGGYLFGSGDPGNRGDGILIENAPQNIIGGTGAVGRNVISANEGAGVRLVGTAGGTLLRNNIIGLISSGTSALGNSGPGVLILTAGNTVEGGNIISANLRGIEINGAGAFGNTIRDNFIGTDVTGAIDIGNAQEGVRIEDAFSNLILGDGEGSQLISGNDVGVVIVGAGATHNALHGNDIGLDATGTIPIGNSKEGVRIVNAPDTTLAGAAAGKGNRIVGNHWGVVLDGPGTVGTLLQDNEIRGSDREGVRVINGASNNLIGGPGNTITDNRGAGVLVEAGSRNAIRGNAIHANGGLGIDLLPGANGDPQPPALTAVITGGSLLSVQGTVGGAPGTTYIVEIFSSDAADPSGFGEGQRYLGWTTATTDAAGNGVFAFELATGPIPGQFISATATDPAGNTSEFSGVATAGTATIEFSTSSIEVSEAAGAATVTVKRSGVLGATVSVAYRTEGGTATAGADYTAVSGTLTFAPGETVKIFTIPIANDTAIEADETVVVTLSNPGGAATLGPQASATVTIRDDDHDPVAFTTASSIVNEGGAATITVLRRGPTGASASVSYAVVGGSATPGSDYVPTSGVLIFQPGQDRLTFTVQTIDDGLIESDETIRIALSDPSGLSLGAPNEATVTIRDNDQPGVVQLLASEFPVREDNGGVWVIATRTGGAAGRLTVPYATAPGSARPGEDYVPVSGTLVFEPGQTIAAFVVPIRDDRRVEGAEAFYVAIGHPVGGATLGPQWASAVTIRDDDFDRAPPRVLGVEPIVWNSLIVGLTVTFSEPLDPVRAMDPYNYDGEFVSAGRDGRFGTVDDIATPIKAVGYLPGSTQVALLPVRPLPLAMRHRLQINRFLGPVAGSGVADVSGNLLDGDSNGLAGGAYVTEFGAPIVRRRVLWR